MAQHNLVGSPMTKPLAQPLWVRISHWCNALAVILMIMSGWRIYNASPVFSGLTLPSALTLGGWLGGALQWHFAAMWLLVANAVFYAACNVATGRIRTRFFPLSPRAVFNDALAALKGRLAHADPSQYNAVQKLLYLFVMVDVILLVMSGLAIWKPVQLAILTHLFGGYDFSRVVHFCAMALLAAFIVLHVAMVLLVPRSLLTMIRGR